MTMNAQLLIIIHQLFPINTLRLVPASDVNFSMFRPASDPIPVASLSTPLPATVPAPAMDRPTERQGLS
jgi:hypothetical protein